MAAGKYIFDESANSYMTTGFDMVRSGGGYSIVFKAKWNTGLTGYHTIIGGTQSGMYVSVNNDVAAISWGGLSADTWVNDGLEHIFILKSDGDTDVTFWVDGTLDQTKAIGAINIPAGSNLEFGRWKAGEPIANAELSHFYAYSRELTAQEVTDINTDISDNPQTNLLLEYKDNKTTSTWTEEVGGNDATNAGGVVFEESAPPPTTTTLKTTWTDSVSAGITGHKVYRDDVEIADVGMGVEVWYDATAEIDSTYKYEVQAYSASDETTTETVGVNVKSFTVIAAPTGINVVEI